MPLLKPASAVASRNVYAPRCAMARHIAGIDAGSGSVILNVASTHGQQGVGNGQLQDMAGAAATTGWASDSEGPYLNLYNGGTGRRVRVETNSSGSVRTFQRITWYMRFRMPAADGGAGRFIFSSSDTSTTTNGTIWALKSSGTNQILVRGRAGGATHTLAITPASVSSYMNLIVTVDEYNGLQAWLDGVALTTLTGTPGDVKSVSIQNGQSWLISQGTGGAYGLVELATYALLTVPLRSKDREWIAHDPYTYIRPMPTEFEVPNYFVGICKPTSFKCKIRAAADLSGRARMRMVACAVASGAAALNAASPTYVSDLFDTTTPDDYAFITVSGITSEARVLARLEWTPDGTNFYPMPGPHYSIQLQRTTPAAYDVLVMPDDHRNSVHDGGVMSDAIFDADLYRDPGVTAVARASGARRKTWYAWLGALDMFHRYHGSSDFSVMIGDNVYPDTAGGSGLGDANSGMRTCWVAWMRSYYLFIACGGTYMLEGNHEMMGAYRAKQGSGTKATAKQAIGEWIKWTCNPGEGDYTQGVDTADWDVDRFPADWTATDHATFWQRADNLHAGSKRHTWAFEWGGVLHIGLATEAFARVGEYDISVASRPDLFKIGAHQKAWYFALLENASGPVKVWAHKEFGSEPISPDGDVELFYGMLGAVHIGDRPYYARLGIKEEMDMHEEHMRLKRCGGVRSSGHYHKGSHHVTQFGTHVFNHPCLAANTHYEADATYPGRNSPFYNRAFGTAASNGAVDNDGTDLATKGVRCLKNVLGYGVVHYEPGSGFKYKMIRTAMASGTSAAEGSGDGEIVRRLHVVEQAMHGPTLTPSDGKITFADALNASPHLMDIGLIADEGDITNDWWTTRPVNRHRPAAWDTRQAAHALDDVIIVEESGILAVAFDVTGSGATAGSPPTWPSDEGGEVADGEVAWFVYAICDPQWGGYFGSIEEWPHPTVVPVSLLAVGDVIAEAVPWVVYESAYVNPPRVSDDGQCMSFASSIWRATVGPAAMNDREIVIDRLCVVGEGTVVVLSGAQELLRVMAAPGKPVDLKGLRLRGGIGQRVAVETLTAATTVRVDYQMGAVA